MVDLLTSIEPFISRPFDSIHLAEISRIIHLPHPTVRLQLMKLEKFGVLRKKSKGRLSLYSLNFENPILMDYILIAEKSLLVKRLRTDILLKEIVSFFYSQRSYNSKCVIFGSFVQNTENYSDIDVLFCGKIHQEALNSFSERYNFNIHLIQVKNLKMVSFALKKEILKKHLLLFGSEEVLRWMYEKH